MRLATAPDKAESVTTMRQAATLYNSIEHELELGNYTEAESDAADTALATLEDRFPGVHREARNVTDPPSLSRGAGGNLDRGDGTGDAGGDGAGGGSSGRARRPGGSPRSSSSARRRPSHGRSSSAGDVFEGAFGFTGEDVSDAVIGWLRWLLLAGIVYQLLAPNAKGKYAGADAFAKTLGGLGKLVNAIVAPVDPFVALGGRSSSAVAAVSDGPPAPVPDTSPAPAPSTSAPGRNLFTAPFSTFPRVPSPFPLPNAPGVTPLRASSTVHINRPAPVLRIGSNPLSIGG